VRTRGALHTLAFLLSVRASFPSHRVSCTSVSRRLHVRPRALSFRRIHTPRLCR